MATCAPKLRRTERGQRRRSSGCRSRWTPPAWRWTHGGTARSGTHCTVVWRREGFKRAGGRRRAGGPPPPQARGGGVGGSAACPIAANRGRELRSDAAAGARARAGWQRRRRGYGGLQAGVDAGAGPAALGRLRRNAGPGDPARRWRRHGDHREGAGAKRARDRAINTRPERHASRGHGQHGNDDAGALAATADPGALRRLAGAGLLWLGFVTYVVIKISV